MTTWRFEAEALILQVETSYLQAKTFCLQASTWRFEAEALNLQEPTLRT